MRTLASIKAEINAEVASNPILSATLTSVSTLAIWSWVVEVISRILLLQEEIFTLHRIDVQAILNRSIAGVDAWYVQKMLEFQYGYTITFNPTTYQVEYTTQDTVAQIIKYAGAVSNAGFTIIKVAKQVGGLPEPLDVGELIAAKAYLDRVQFAGAQVSLLSIPADALKIQGTIYYNGQRDLTEVQTETEAAINAYINGLEFNSVLYRNKLVDSIQALGSDIDIDILQVYTVSSTWQDIDRSYIPASGFFVIDSGFPLSANLTYIAE